VQRGANLLRERTMCSLDDPLLVYGVLSYVYLGFFHCFFNENKDHKVRFDVPNKAGLAILEKQEID